MAVNKRPRVIIIGAGFGGLWAARTLANHPVDVLIIDRNNYHTFLPLLYQVAAAELEPEQIAYPVRSILRKLPNVDFIMSEVKRVDFGARLVVTDGPAISYDYLIVGIGSVSHFFGVPGAAEHAFLLKNLDQGVTLRNHILCHFEQAAYETDEERRRRLLTFTIVGGGPTGVEFAGALAELIRGPLVKDYPAIDFERVRVVLVEASNSLLSHLPERLQAYTLERLHDMGVEVILGAVVDEIEGEAVRLKNGGVIPTETVVWTAGVRGDPKIQDWGLPVARDGRVAVQSTLQAPGQENVYVVGDLAYVEEDGRPLPMIAPVAIQEGSAAARNVIRQVSGQEPLAFQYKDKGTMATIGRNAAAVRLGARTYTGFFAWLLWLGVHLFYLIGFRNRLIVMFSWSIDYFFFERAVRLIFPSDKGVRCAAVRRRENIGDDNR